MLVNFTLDNADMSKRTRVRVKVPIDMFSDLVNRVHSIKGRHLLPAGFGMYGNDHEAKGAKRKSIRWYVSL